jgi:protein-S-isoprenylcysteine O-methyltransferase Ste14
MVCLVILNGPTPPRPGMIRSAYMLALQIVPCAVAVFLGWGFGNLPRFCQNPARCGLVLLGTGAAVAVVAMRLDVYPLRGGKGSAGTENLELAILLGSSLTLLWFLPFADRRNFLTLHAELWRYVGLVLCCVGVVVRLLALRALGKQFSAYITLQSNHELIRNGIYKHLRHPLYLSLLLVPAGIALVFASLLALPVALLAVIFITDRIKKEEQLLAAHFGGAFEGYRKSNWGLLPFVY